MADAAQAVEEKQEPPQETPQQDSQKQAQNVELSEVTENDNTSAGTSIDVLLDMSVPVTAVIDRTELPIHKLLQLGPGSVLKLDKTIAEPVDLYLKNVKFATATVVVIDDRFGVRIKEILGTGIDPGSTNA